MTNTNPPEIIVVDPDTHNIACDGGAADGNSALGHPKVWYTFDGNDSVECKYCDRLFVIKGSAAEKSAKKLVNKTRKKTEKKKAS